MYILRIVGYKLRILSELIRGLDFSYVEEVTHLKGSEMEYTTRASPSPARILIEVLKDINIQPEDAIIDIGCGKGYAINIFRRFPFSRIDGIEVNNKVAKIAMRNFDIIKDKRIHIYNDDALIFNDYDAYNFVYMYNPFPCFVMEKVMHFLIESLKDNDREIIILYYNPVCHKVIIKTKVFKMLGYYYKPGYHYLNIYSNRDIKESRLKNCKVIHLTV